MIAGHLQQKRGHWYMVLNFYDSNGKRKPKWIATHLPVPGNKRKAEEMLLMTRQRYSKAESKKASGDMFFADYMQQWLENVRSKVAPTTYHGYKHNVENVICPYFKEKGILLRDVRPIDLERFYAELQNQGLSGNTVIHYHANIHKALQDAVRLDLVDRNAAMAVERPKKEKYLPAHYSKEEANQLLELLNGHWMYLPVALSLFYGLRRGEVLGLRWGDIDFETGTITIQHTRAYKEVDGKYVIAGRHMLKRKSSYRTLPMPDPVKELLLDARSAHYADCTTPAEDYVCLNREEKPIALNYFSQCFKQFLRDNGLREIRLHDLRHTCASLLIQSRVPLIEVQQWLGHSTIETTADLYAHLEYESKQGNAELLKKI